MANSTLPTHPPLGSHRSIIATLIAALAFLALLASPQASWALQPSEILLITNKNAPESQSLAKLYCQLRGVPADNIVALDLPDAEEMPFETYETNVIIPLRAYLETHNLRSSVKCLLTFYGVPFRIREKQNSPADQHELAELKDLQTATGNELQTTVENFEKHAEDLSPLFRPDTGTSTADLLARAQSAILATTAKIPGMATTQQQNDTLNQVKNFILTVGGEAELDNRLGAAERNDSSRPPEQRQAWIDLHNQIASARQTEEQLQARRWDATARANLRTLAKQFFGLVGLSRVLDAQVTYLTPTASGAATDNELALLWWDYYPRQRWLANPLNFNFAGNAPPTLMVMRLDGPDPATVVKMMHTSVDVEKTGLTGTFAIDARGLSPLDDKGNPSAFGQFDETLRRLATIVRTKTKLTLAFDDQDIVFPPHYVKNVACYVGWYSVSHYIPGCDFNPGAIGYHIASYEMVTLHFPSPEWVRGLLTDGVVATLGPVAEPYLAAFPRPDEFFPLLLTGKLTLAEVYWKTTPMTSWMITFIGDPLYTPYRVNPPMKADDLPYNLRKAIQ